MTRQRNWLLQQGVGADQAHVQRGPQVSHLLFSVFWDLLRKSQQVLFCPRARPPAVADWGSVPGKGGAGPALSKDETRISHLKTEKSRILL